MSVRRTSLDITLSVWKALFLREAVGRLSKERAAWLWLLLEPLVHVLIMLVIFAIIRIHVIGGMDTTVWLMIGMTAFLMFRRTATQTKNAVNSNGGLFAYRQVKPVDTVLVRGFLEGMLTVLVTVILFVGLFFVGFEAWPDDPLAMLASFLGLWLLGVGYGLIVSVVEGVVPEIGKLIDFTMTPLYFASAVIYPMASIPPPYRDWLMLNPVAQGLEAARMGFAHYYHVAPELSFAYLYLLSLVMIFLGLALQVRYASRLAAQ